MHKINISMLSLIWHVSCTLYITQYLHDTRDGLSIISRTLTPQSWQHRIRKRLLPKLRTPTKQTVHAEGRIRLHIYIVEAIHHKAFFGRELHFKQYLRIHHSMSAQIKTVWCKEVAISARYQAYRKPSTPMLPKL